MREGGRNEGEGGRSEEGGREEMDKQGESEGVREERGREGGLGIEGGREENAYKPVKCDIQCGNYFPHTCIAAYMVVGMSSMTSEQVSKCPVPFSSRHVCLYLTMCSLTYIQ